MSNTRETDFFLSLLPQSIAASLPKHIVIFGLGYTTNFLMQLCLYYGVRVSATCRSEQKKQYLQTRFPEGNIIIFNDLTSSDEDNEKLKEAVLSADALVSSIPPQDGNKDPVLTFLQTLYPAHHQAEMYEKNVSQKWLGYLSATSVYGNHDGKWVNEESQILAQSERGIKRYEAENLWKIHAMQYKMRLNIFRLPGIYGPHRSVFDRLVHDNASFINKTGHIFCRVYVYDIIRALSFSMALHNTTPMELGQADCCIYNLSDDEPATQKDLYRYAAKLRQINMPKAIDYKNANMSAMRRSFYTDSRKISNKKIKKELNFTFMFPTYREGLKHILSLESYEIEIK